MSSRNSYNQKKKKEALRRLSQSGSRGTRTSRSASTEDAQRFGQSSRVRRRRDRPEREDAHQGGGLFSGRRVIATDSPSSGSNLVIQASVESQSSGADTPDTTPDKPRRLVTSQAPLFGVSTDEATGTRPQSGNVFARVGGMSTETFGSVLKSSDESTASRSLFQTESSNPFAPTKGQFGSASTNVFSAKGDTARGNIFGEPILMKLSPKTSKASPLDSKPGRLSEPFAKSEDGAPGLDSVTRNLFGKPAPKSSDPNPPLFGKPLAKPDQTSAASSITSFKRDVDGAASDQRPDRPQKKVHFGKVLDTSGRRERDDASSKRQLSPGRAETSSKRTLTTFDDPFSSGSSDITDLETFGASMLSKESRQKKTVIKRSGLFGKALAEASGVSHESVKETLSSRSHRDEDRKSRSRSPPERKHHDWQAEDRRKKPRDENKPGRSSSVSSSSSRRYASPEQIKHLVGIIVKDVPPSANYKPFLKKFFSEFGPVTRIYTNPNKSSATIYFADHDSAAEAKKKTKILKRRTKPVSIFWRQSDLATRSERRLSQDDEKSPRVASRQDDKQTVQRPSLAPFNRKKTESKVNPEDGTAGRSIPLANISIPSSAALPKTTNLAIPAHLLSKQVGLTAQERYDILEDRDKIIRQGLKKNPHLATSAAIRGTCPDMCPEKERYMRVVQRRLHPYEVVPGTTDRVNHDTAVKEYSRSSADQEEPLPHEMRPAPVLTMTMNYLMRHVMNTGRDGHWEEWFDFLWSRTRGIRKDITQQDLRDLTAIDLMEKCARFHIFCSHRLCEEDRSTIDPKINNENLTKCMQSLKHFYRDLASEGAVCPNEAEFRAYDVLLNLNDRDILRQVQQYRMEVRSSESVKFALKAFSAVSSNNYVKFFKLVRSTTYLNACIMHRYFMQVRNMALDVMNKAYTISQARGSRFPLANIERTLAFDDQLQAAEFCQSHNLTVEDDSVHFSRAAFQHPDISQSAERSHRVIEAKNTMTIGEVVNGGPLPEDVPHKPSSSFDENGNYKGYTAVTKETAATAVAAATTAASESKEVAVAEKARMEELASQPVGGQAVVAPTASAQSPAKATYSNMEVKEVARGLFLEVIDEMVQDLSSRFLGWLHLIQYGSVEIQQEALVATTSPMMREIAAEVMEEQRLVLEQQRLHEAQMAELERRRQLEQQAIEEQRQHQAMVERREWIKQAAEGVLGQTLDEVVQEEARIVADAEIKAVRQQLKEESLERCMTQLCRELLEETVDSSCRQVLVEVIQTEKAKRDQRLAECEKAFLMGQMAKYLHRWHKVYTKRIHLKRTLRTFPAAPPNQTAAEQLRVLWAGRAEKSGALEGQRRRDVTLDSPFGIVKGRERIAKSILKIHYLKSLRHQEAWSPLDLPGILSSAFGSHHAPGPVGGHHGSRQQQLHHFWKLVVSLPGGAGPHGNRVLCDWLKAKLRRGRISENVRRHQLEDNAQVETLSLYSARVPHVSPSQLCTLSICTKVTTGSLDGFDRGQTRRQMLGTSGILFALEPVGDNQAMWHEAKSRLESNLRSRPISPSLPVVILLLDWSATEHAQYVCEKALQLPRLTEMGLLSSYRFVSLTGDCEAPENSAELIESLEWLSIHCPGAPVLSEDALKGYLDTGMTEFFSLPLHEDAKMRRDTGLPEQDCHRVVDLHNAVVRHLADVASSSSLTSLSWPPTEFTKAANQTELPKPDWNAEVTVRQLRERILALTLPGLPPINENDDWESVCEVCREYLTALPGSPNSKVPLFARVQRILDRCQRTFEDTCYLAFDAPGCEPLAGHVPWTRIIGECSDYVMSTIQSNDVDGHDDLITVYYQQTEFDRFQAPRTWKEGINATVEESFIQPPRFASQVAQTVHQKQIEFVEKQQEATMIEMTDNQKPSTILLEREPSIALCASESAQAVRALLSSAKEESKKYDDLLQEWLGGTDKTTSREGMKVAGKKSPASVDSSPPPLEQSLQDLRLTMEAERRADRLAELRLASLLSL